MPKPNALAFCIALILGSAASAQVSEDPPLRVSVDGTPMLWSAKNGERVRGSVIQTAPGVMYSPDGARRLHIDRQTLIVADKDGRNELHLTPADMAAQLPAWTADGRQIVFLASRGQPVNQIYAVDVDGRNLRQLTDLPQGARNPQIGPDGRVAYIQQVGPVAKHPLCDLVIRDLRADPPAAPVVVAHNLYINQFAWSPDGKSIAYSTLGELVIHGLAANAADLRFALADIDPKLSGHAASHIAWSPDGAAVACALFFLGDRQNGSPRMLGDQEVFIFPRQGKPHWFAVGGPVEQLAWPTLQPAKR